MSARACISFVEEHSPAYYAGFTEGCVITAVDGHEIRDIIDWRWYSSEDCIDLSYVDTEGDSGLVTLEREHGQDWGISFSDALFDAPMQCCNACIFCFIRQLPADARDSLTYRDDDFRLSFLQGNFVTFTNLSAEDEQRIVQQHISPLRFSLHASTPDLRKQIMGIHAAHGLEVAERLLAVGIELHAQIVLMPSVNDGEELQKTLQWAFERPGILNVGIVPVGYTKYQSNFTHSFNDRFKAQGVIDCIRPFQEQALAQRGSVWVYASDEFYRNAYPDTLLENLPPALYYGDFSLFDDGIGIVRSFVDDFLDSSVLLQQTALLLSHLHMKVYFICGCAQREFFTPLLNNSPCNNFIIPLYVENNYFGGNVDVTGLLCACDIIPAAQDALSKEEKACMVVIPKVIFNADGITLDNHSLADIENELPCPVFMVSCQASEFLAEICSIVGNGE